jgi:hypothetical protein
MSSGQLLKYRNGLLMVTKLPRTQHPRAFGLTLPKGAINSLNAHCISVRWQVVMIAPSLKGSGAEIEGSLKSRASTKVARIAG